MADETETEAQRELRKSVENFADTMFAKIAITVLFGEVAKLQGDNVKAAEFLVSRQSLMESFLDDLVRTDDAWDVLFRARFNSNIKAMFDSIDVGSSKS